MTTDDAVRAVGDARPGVGARPRMRFRRRMLLASPLPAAWMSNVVIHNVYVKFYTDVIGLDPAHVGWVYLAFNVWNVLNDPFAGVLLDKLRYRTGRTPAGRRRLLGRGKYLRVMRVTVPFMLVGIVAMAWSSPDWPQAVTLAVFLLELFIFDVASTFYQISAVSYTLLAAPTREDRIDVEVVRVWIANISSAVATVVATQLLVGDAITEHTTIATLLMGVVAVNGLLYLVPTVLLKDPPELYQRGDGSSEQVTPGQLLADARSIMRMRGFWAWFAFGLTGTAPMGVYFTAYLYLMDHVIGSTGTQATMADVGSMAIVLLLLPLLARQVKRIGSRTSIWLGLIPYLAGLSAIFLVQTWWQVLLSYAALMTGKHIITTAGVAIDAALIDDNERTTGTRKTGSFAAIRAILSAPLSGAQMTIFLAVIAHFGYDQAADVQTATAQFGIRVATAGIPIMFGLLGTVPLLFLPYGKRREAELSEFSRARREDD